MSRGVWTLTGHPAVSPQQPRPRLFHASALLGDTMVVLGGRSDPDEFSSDVLLYQVNCNAWLLPDLTRKSSAPLGSPCPGTLTHHPRQSCFPLSYLNTCRDACLLFLFLESVSFVLIIKVIIFIACNW